MIKTSEIIKNKRIEKNLTQLDLANLLGVTDRAVSKWERGVGLPDPSLWSELSKILEINLETLLNGYEIQKHKTLNTLKSKFYVCNKCMNVIYSLSKIDVSCCGTKLTEVKLNDNELPFLVTKEKIENDLFIKIEHPMTKKSYLAFLAQVSYDKATIVKTYPEQSFEIRIPLLNKANLYVYDSLLGLFKI